MTLFSTFFDHFDQKPSKSAYFVHFLNEKWRQKAIKNDQKSKMAIFGTNHFSRGNFPQEVPYVV